MRNKNGKRSLYPAWTITTATLSMLGTVFAVGYLLDSHALSANQLQALAAAYLIIGFSTFSLTTIIDNMIDLHRDIREDKRAAAEFDAHLAEHRQAHEAALRGRDKEA